MSPLLAALLAAGPARSAPRLAVVDAPVVPGRATWVELADDAPGALPRELTVRGGTLRPWISVRPGVWRAQLVPAVGADAVEISGPGLTLREATVSPGAADFEVPDLVDATVGAAEVTVPVSGFDGDPDALQLDVSEGSARAVRGDDGVVVVVTPDPLLHPRWVLLAVRDRRTDDAPAVARLRLRGRPRIPLQVEPGVSLVLEVGGRTYGPFAASDSGLIDGRVDQYPGESAATAVFTDALGNVTRSELPLVVDGEPVLVASAGEAVLPGRAPPLFHLAAVGPGGAWSSAAPTCRAPFGEVPVRADRPGTWFGALPPLGEPEDVRLVCTLGGRQAALRVPVAAVPARLTLRVWPDDLRADFPTAEVRVALEDWRGDRLPVDRVELRAELGHVDAPGPVPGPVEYDGTTAVAAGRDEVVATWAPPPGDGPPLELDLGWSVTPAAVTLSVVARDWLRRPLAGVPIRLAAGEERADVVTGPGGTARAVFAPDVRGPVPVSASFVAPDGRVRERRGFVVPGEAPAAVSGVLAARAALSLRPGRVVGLDVDVQPPLLRAGPGAVAWVVVRMEDGLGQPIVDEPVDLVVSEGEVGDLHPRGDGSLVAEYQPLPITSRREIEVTASTSTVHSSARLVVEPRVVRYGLGPWIGLTSRFGPRVLPSGGVDLDARLRNPLFGESLILRGGVSVTPSTATVETGVGPAAQLRSTLVPASFAFLLRQDRGPWALWGGVGFAAGVQHLQVRFGSDVVSEGDSWVLGPEVHAAVARRALGGEGVLGVRGTWLDAPVTEVGWTGNLGGVSATLGYRVVW